MSFSIDDKDKKRIEDWWKLHRCKTNQETAIDGKLTFCFTPTGLGIVSMVKCECGIEFDFTNYKEW